MMQFQGFTQDSVSLAQKQQMFEMYGNMVKSGMHAKVGQTQTVDNLPNS
jgi:hypothetical protein